MSDSNEGRMKPLMICSMVLFLLLDLAPTANAARYGSHRVGGRGPYGKGSHYVGGHRSTAVGRFLHRHL